MYVWEVAMPFQLPSWNGNILQYIYMYDATFWDLNFGLIFGGEGVAPYMGYELSASKYLG